MQMEIKCQLEVEKYPNTPSEKLKTHTQNPDMKFR